MLSACKPLRNLAAPPQDSDETAMLMEISQQAFDLVRRIVAENRPRLETIETGLVSAVSEGVVEVRGFTEIAANELVRLPQNLYGLAADVSTTEMGVILLGSGESLKIGDEVRRTHRVAEVPVGDALLGRIVDPLGQPLDGRGQISTPFHRPIERPAPAIIDRAPVERPLQTGIKAIDAAIPIGRGQRELIAGDRQTGKTAIAVDTIINQAGGDVVSIYCAVGQRGDAVARVIADLERGGVLGNTVVVVAGGEASPGLQYIAPYAATSIGEWFMERGQDVLIVYDDLTRHARAYRQLSLLLRRPPGREAYPGDIFYIHSRLLERATHLRESRGGGSLTALPIIETQAQNLAAYIPTNLISITDGQIYLSPDLFQKGQLPAIDLGRSVSRVGGRAQLPVYRAIAGPLKLFHSQFEELETFARFGTRLDEDTRRKLARGERVRAVLKQPQGAPIPVPEQIAVLYAVTHGLFDHLSLEDLENAEAGVRAEIRRELPAHAQAIMAGDRLTAEHREALDRAIRTALNLIGHPLPEETDHANA